MEILGIIVGAYLFVWLMCRMTIGLAPHTYFTIIRGVKSKLGPTLKDGYTLKATDYDYNWNRTDYGDFNTRWIIINKRDRTKDRIEMSVDRWGNLISIDSKYHREILKNAITN